MIMSRYNSVTVLSPTLPTVTITVFEPTLRNVTSTVPTVTDRYRSLPKFTVTCVTTFKSVTDRNKGPLEQIFKVLLNKLM